MTSFTEAAWTFAMASVSSTAALLLYTSAHAQTGHSISSHRPSGPRDTERQMLGLLYTQAPHKPDDKGKFGHIHRQKQTHTDTWS